MPVPRTVPLRAAVADRARPRRRAALRAAVSGPAVLALLLTGVASPAAGAATPPASTPWAGWQVERPAGSCARCGVAGSGAVELVDDGRRFSAWDGRARVVGAVPSYFLGGSSNPASAVLPSGRVLLLANGRVGFSDDLGRTWSSGALPSSLTSPGPTVALTFRDARHGILVRGTPEVALGATFPGPGERTGPSVDTTADGGKHWTSVRSPEPAPKPSKPNPSGDPGISRDEVQDVVPGPSGSWLRVLRERADREAVPAAVLERSTDDGATWTRTELPGVPTPEAVAAGATPVAVGRPQTTGDAVVVPVGNAVLVSRDDLRTFTAATAPGEHPQALCDADGCLVGLTTGGERSEPRQAFAVPFDGSAFGARLPALPLSAQRPAPGSVLGIAASDGGSPAPEGVVRSDDGGRTYRPSAGTVGPVRWLPPGSGPLRARLAGATIEASSDGVRWSAVPLPRPDLTVAQVAAAPGGLLLLDDAGTVWRRQGGAWRSWSARAILPRAVAADGDAVLVAGARGLLRRSGGRTTRVLVRRGARIAGAAGPRTTLPRGLTGVALRGRLAFAWGADDDRTAPRVPGAGGLLRSADGGRTWRRLPGPPHTDDLQIVSSRTVLRTHRSSLYASDDAGHRFARRGRVEGTSRTKVARLAFHGPRAGVVGTSVTTDGGRSLTRIPLVPDGTDLLALAGRGVVQAGPLGAVLRAPRLLEDARVPRLSARAIRRSRKEPGGLGIRNLDVRGRIRATGMSAEVEIVTTHAPGAAVRVSEVQPVSGDDRLDSSFEGTVRFRPGRDRLWRVQTAGGVGPDGTALGTETAWQRLPR